MAERSFGAVATAVVAGPRDGARLLARRLWKSGSLREPRTQRVIFEISKQLIVRYNFY
jgi:hypothetical protein